MQNLNFTSITPDELKDIVTSAVRQELSKQKQKDDSQDDLLKIEQVREIFKVSKVTIHNWKKSGKLPFYRINSRVFFKKSEVLDALQSSKKKIPPISNI